MAEVAGAAWGAVRAIAGGTDLARKADVRTDEAAATLRGFAWWFGASDLPTEWRLAEVYELLGQKKIQPEPAFLVAEQLPAITDAHPQEALGILRLLIENGDSWAVDAWREHIEDVLRVSFRSTDPDASSRAQEMVDWLLARGYRGFRAIIEA